ncbi:hypothetical protein [Mycobacteroides chelonae]|uniref:hypothetical protein n=1 Tax=Mycobacteroides chelonae TaxID=1774 RepID=UPI0008A864E2|nr:hypothetical protein [Mycobacteroides chelonae]OHT73337.1 hypothetical protein BKG66_07760 [Mycobacteroides chelonae]OHT75927.1 hypothetical protein BKG67_04810 [Mycobacteroides chelonae]
MKILAAVMLVPLLLLVGLGVAVYNLVVSIPAWLFVVAIGVLWWKLRKERRGPRRETRNDRGLRGPRPDSSQWGTYCGPQAPTVVYVLPSAPSTPVPPVLAARRAGSAPQPWKLT